MIYTIGYQKMKDIDELVEILKAHEIEILIDVRSRPYGRKVAFNKKKLIEQLTAHGIRYKWAGQRLGGFSSIADEDIARLAEWQKDKTTCIMCMEADPDQCHRKNEIGARLAKHHQVQAHHLVRSSSGWVTV